MQMSLQKQVESINRFLLCDQCIYTLTTLDYPSDIQQMSIKSYLLVKDTINESKDPLKHFQQTSFKNINLQRSIIIGLFYYSLLHPATQEAMFKYVKQMGSDALNFYASYLVDFSTKEIERVNEESILVLPTIYAQLIKYNILVTELTIAMTRTINFIDLSERGLTYADTLVEAFLQVVNFVSIAGVGRLIFTKILRIMTSVFLIEDEEITQFKDKCIKLLLLLWNKDKQECVTCGIEGFRYFQQLMGINSLRQLFQSYKELYYAQQNMILSVPKRKNDELLAINIPVFIFEVVSFSLNTDAKQIFYQMGWLEKKNKDNRHFQMLLVDLLRYMVRIVDHPNRFIFIEWILGYCGSSKCTPICWHLCQQALFFDWFFYGNLDENLVLQFAWAGLYILNMLLHLNPIKCQQLLQFILYQQLRQFEGAPKIKQNLKRVFRISEQKGCFKYSQLLGSNFIDGGIKEEIKILLMSNQIHDSNQDSREYTVPMMRMESTESDDIWGHETYVEPKFQSQKELGVLIVLEKHYYEQSKAKLNAVLELPSKTNYQSLLDHMVPYIKKSYTDSELYQKFVRETIKIAYLLFQSHFQFFWQIPSEQNIISIHIQALMRLWGSNDIALEIHKKMIKGLIITFPISFFSVYFSFLQLVSPSRVHCQQVSVFLLDKKKQKFQKVVGQLIQDPRVVEATRMKGLKYKLSIV